MLRQGLAVLVAGSIHENCNGWMRNLDRAIANRLG
jgi:hypothetical protein